MVDFLKKYQTFFKNMVDIKQMQYGFMSGRGTVDAVMSEETYSKIQSQK